MSQIPDGVKAWIDARRRHHLSHAHVQMARELGMNPRRLGGLDNHRQERWKAPLPIFIEDLYLERFGRERPEVVRSIEEWFRQQEMKKVAKRAAKRRRRQALTEAAAVPDKPVTPAAPAVEPRATARADSAGRMSLEIDREG